MSMIVSAKIDNISVTWEKRSNFYEHKGNLF